MITGDDNDDAGEPNKYNLTTLTGSERSSVLGNFKEAVEWLELDYARYKS